MTASLLAVETGGTKVIARLHGPAGEREGRWATTTPDQAFADVSAFVDAPLGGVGIAAFGPLLLEGNDTGRMLATTKPHWTGSNLARALAERFGCPVVVDSDVNAAARAELVADDAAASLAYVTVGTGLGGGLASAAGTLRGAMHPEIGHLRLIRRAGDDAPSACPFHSDCAEGLVAGLALGLRLGGAPLAERPDVAVLLAEYLAQLLTALVLAWAPHRIVLGGGVGTAPGVLAAVRRTFGEALGRYGVPEAARRPDFLRAPAYADAGLEGALLMAREAAGR